VRNGFEGLLLVQGGGLWFLFSFIFHGDMYVAAMPGRDEGAMSKIGVFFSGSFLFLRTAGVEMWTFDIWDMTESKPFFVPKQLSFRSYHAVAAVQEEAGEIRSEQAPGTPAGTVPSQHLTRAKLPR
jgi:hypothetical protein